MLNKMRGVAPTALVAITLSSPVMALDPSHLEHPHGAGTLMVEFDYMRMQMDGLLEGKESVSNLVEKGTYLSEPTTMSMDMFMLMPMYNFTSNLSGMVMFNYLINSMDMRTRADSTTIDDMMMMTQGIGDTEIDLSYKFLDNRLAASFGLSLPTGSITEDMSMHMYMYHAQMGHNMNMLMSDTRASYMMQLGSGTYDVTPSLTYLGAYYTWLYGAQASYTYRIGENSEGYTLGDKAKALAWVRKPVPYAVLSAQLEFTRWGDIEGKDKMIETMMPLNSANNLVKASPDAFTYNYGGSLLDVAIGATFPVGPVNLGVKAGMPVYQKLNGVQMKTAYTFTTSVSAMF